MGSLNIDQNAWYQIAVTRQSGQSLRGTVLYDNGDSGAVFYEITNTSSTAQSWQFYAYNSSVYLLRCRISGPDAYLGSIQGSGSSSDPGKDVAGDTSPYMATYNISDSSMFWQAGTWTDGTIYFYNLSNGSDWRLDVLSDSLMVMSSNISAPQIGEQFSYTKLGAIDDSQWSTYNTYPATRTAQATVPSTTLTTSTADTTNTKTGTSATQTSSSSSSSSSSGSSGGSLSTGAVAGIGVAIGILVVAVGVLAGILFLRRRRRGGRETPIPLRRSKMVEIKEQTDNPAEVAGSRIYAEMPTTSPSEGRGGHGTVPVELAGDSRY